MLVVVGYGSIHFQLDSSCITRELIESGLGQPTFKKLENFHLNLIQTYGGPG